MRKPWIELRSQNQNDEDMESFEPWNFDRLDINLKMEDDEMMGEGLGRDSTVVGGL